MAYRKILVIDDEPSVCDIMAMILEDAGYTVDRASGGLEGLAKLKKALPSLVILDLMMPCVSGWDVYDAIRRNKRTRSIPVVVTSADRDVLSQAKQMGATAQICKPFQLEELLKVVEDNLPLPPRRKHVSAQPCRGVA